jgi:hypothetical protein
MKFLENKTQKYYNEDTRDATVDGGTGGRWY